MVEKGDLAKYLVIGLICVGLAGLLLVLRIQMTGYAVYEYEGDITERGSYWNKIDSGGGSYNLKIYGNIVNYDNGSEYVAIENSIENSSYLDYEYEIIGEYNLYLQDNIQAGKGIRFEKDGYYMTYDLGGGKMQWAVEAGNPTKVKSIGSILSSNIIIGEGNVTYEDAFSNTDVQYIIGPNMLKENFILKSLPSPDLVKLYLEYTGEIQQSNDLVVYANGQNYAGKEFNTTGSIEFRDSDNNTIFYLPKPYATDANGDYSDMVYDIKISAGKIQFGLRVDASWLNNASRVFPVVIDPSIKLSGSGGDVYVDKLTLNRNHGDKDYLKIQRSAWQRAYLKFNVSAIPSGQIIDNASLCLFLDNDQGSQTISANHVYDDSWCEGDGGTDGSPACEITWDNQPCGIETESLNSAFCNATAESSLINDGGQDDTWQCWDVVNMIGQEYDSSNKSVSMVLWTTDTGSADIFHSKEYSNSSLWPYLNISYHTANTAPSLDLVSPQDGATYSYNESLALDFSVSDSDGNLDSCWYNINGGANVSLPGCANTTFDVSGDGDYVLNIYANDSLGLEASGSVDFGVDVTGVSLSISEPSGAKTSKTDIPIAYTATGNNLMCWYNVGFATSEGGQVNITLANCTGSSFDVSVDGNYVFNLYLNNSFGSSDSANSSFSVSVLNSGTNPGGSSNNRDSGSGDFAPLTAKLSFSGAGNIIVHEGDEKTVSLNAKNTGGLFLNNCRLIVRGDISSWTYSDKVEGIAPGENVDFVFKLNVPEGVEPGDSSGELEIKCNEVNETQSIVVSVLGGFGLIEIKDIKKEKGVLNINYDFDNSNLIGEEASVDIWIVDADGVEVKRVQDVFAINRDGLIERSVEIELSEDLVGIYYVYFALSSNLDDFTKQSVVFGKSGATGLAVFDTTRGKVTIYVILLLGLGVAVFFIWRRHGKTKHGKSKWFFGKGHKK